MRDKIFIDTNIIVYAHDATAPEKRSKAQEIIFEGMRTENATISVQVLSEFFVTITQKVKKPLPITKAKREIFLLSNLEVVDIDSSLVIRAIDIKHKHKLSYWDGLIIAAAERSRCQTVFSEDLSDGQSYGSTRVRNPFSADF